MSTFLNGLEVLFASSRIRCSFDAFIAFLHWTAIDLGYRCVGSNETKITDEEQKHASSMLPESWNANPNQCTLKYVKEQSVLLLKLVKLDDNILVTALDPSTKKSINLNLHLHDFVNKEVSSFSGCYKDVKGFIKVLKTDLFNEISGESAPKSEDKEKCTRRPEREETPRSPKGRRYDPEDYYYVSTNDDWFVAGPGDLDPTGRRSGGMLVQPPGHPLRPPGFSHPDSGTRGPVFPLPRYDPLCPPLPGQPQLNRRFRHPRRPGEPDPDHFPPPGFQDDMFG